MTSVWPADGDDPSRGRYNIQAVTRKTGVPSPTIRAWERRYGLPRPSRSAGRQRLYSEADVRFIGWMRERTAEGMSAARAAALWADTGGQAPTPPPFGGSHPPDDLAHEFVAAVMAHDLTRAELAINGAFALYDLETACTRVIQPALEDIGDRWHRGEVEVATEHLATSVIRGVLGSLLRLVGYDRGERLALVAGAPGERHDLGAQMLALFLARRGLRVLFLGGDVPADSLARMTQQLHPAVVTLSAASPETAATPAETARLLALLPSPPLVVFGGQAFVRWPELIPTVPATFVGNDASIAAQQVLGLLRAS